MVYVHFMIPDIFVVVKIAVQQDLVSQGLFMSDSASKFE